MEFYTILTNVGRNKLAAATANGSAVRLTQMRLGDGNGASYNPTASQTSLRREVWRGNVTLTKVDPQNPNWIVVEVDVPANVGGFMIREAGIFDSDGAMIAISKYPETYKPLVDQGSAKELKVRTIIEVSNASSVTLNINPGVILVNQRDFNAHVTEFNKHVTDVKENYVCNTFQTLNSGSNGTGKYVRLARMVMTRQYNDSNLVLLMSGYNTSDARMTSGQLQLRVKQQSVIGEKPGVSCDYLRYTGTDLVGHFFPIVIENSESRTVVELYLRFPSNHLRFRMANLIDQGILATEIFNNEPMIDELPEGDIIPCLPIGERTLWSGSVSAEGSAITLSDDVGNYTYLKVYGRFYTSVSENLIGELVSTRASYVLRDINLGDAVDNTSLNVAELQLARQGRVLTLIRNDEWHWNGKASSDARKQSLSNLTTITRIVGVRV